MSMDSYGGIRKCIDYLKIDINKNIQNLVRAKINVIAPNESTGSIEVIFMSNWNSGEGPYIEFDETIKGYGIQYTQFKPQWVEMKWNSKTSTLTISNNSKYEFELIF
jgi:hypothetical protein